MHTQYMHAVNIFSHLCTTYGTMSMSSLCGLTSVTSSIVRDRTNINFHYCVAAVHNASGERSQGDTVPWLANRSTKQHVHGAVFLDV